MGKLNPRDVPEALVTLYLRLNGCFTTGLVLHSENWGEARGDIDCLAVWHPGHDQSEREVEPDPFLEFGTSTELLICEVKSSVEGLSFNKRLRTDDAGVDAVLRWSGVVASEHIPNTVQQLLPLVQDDASRDAARAGVTVDNVRIRALLCCPRCLVDQATERWCIRGDQMMEYANRCLNPHRRRRRSSTAYSFDLWGGFLEPLVTYFKSLPHDASPTFADLQAKVGSVR